jgi:septal ring factor EnvC (AmiA/AmiB activator)
LESLKANTLMIERMAHLKELHKLNEKLCGLLDDILQQRLSACSALERHFGSLQRVLSRREAEQTELTTLVEAGRSSASDQEQIVSQEEFAFLLSPEEGEHGEQDKP